MSRATSMRSAGATTKPRRPPVSWAPQTLAVLRIVRRWLANEANDLRDALDELCEVERTGKEWAKRDREALEALYEYARAQQQTLDALLAPQAAEDPPVDLREMLTLNRALEVVGRAKLRARRGLYRRELAAAATGSPGAATGERVPSPRGNEGKSRQAPRRAKAPTRGTGR
ncbi:hypothetical protein WME76_02130 [Sorangium sp. So ce119]|uniref:hypothetical protein n=1 Tax=Sorangium sp. So ce119 TaxID=3133279 RepID=UPI003F5E6391